MSLNDFSRIQEGIVQAIGTNLEMKMIAQYSCYKQLKYILLHKKTAPHVINSRALTGEKPCINKAIHALLMQGYTTFNMITPGHRFAAVTRCVVPALERA